MLIPFDRYDYLLMGDLERCPYPMFTSECVEWCEKDNHRMLIIALERYYKLIKVISNYDPIDTRKVIHL